MTYFSRISMQWIESYLRPLSQQNTGIEAGIERKAEQVDSIQTDISSLDIEQHDSVPVEFQKPVETEEIQGQKVMNEWRWETKQKEVNFSNRHWWIISHGIFKNNNLHLRDEADILDFLLAINLCTDDPVSFSQNPGQVGRRAYEAVNPRKSSKLRYRGDLKPGQFINGLLYSQEIPSVVEIERDVVSVYKMVRKFRSMRVDSDQDMDIRVGLHMYDDGLTSTVWTGMANFYYVCANVLFSGRVDTDTKDNMVSEITNLSKSEAAGWRQAVNRLKHPDEGESGTGILDGDIEVPRLERLRQAANSVLIHAMEQRFTDFDEEL